MVVFDDGITFMEAALHTFMGMSYIGMTEHVQHKLRSMKRDNCKLEQTSCGDSSVTVRLTDKKIAELVFSQDKSGVKYTHKYTLVHIDKLLRPCQPLYSKLVCKTVLRAFQDMGLLKLRTVTWGKDKDVLVL